MGEVPNVARPTSQVEARQRSNRKSESPQNKTPMELTPEQELKRDIARLETELDRIRWHYETLLREVNEELEKLQKPSK